MEKAMITEAVSALHKKYALALDRRDMEGWLECFAEDGTYLCQTKENFDEDLPIGFMWDDRIGRLKDRVKAVNEIWAGTAEDYQPRHFFLDMGIGNPAGDLVEAVSNFVVYYTTNRGDSRILATGEYIDTMRIVNGTARFTSRKAILDQVVVPRYLVYPI